MPDEPAMTSSPGSDPVDGKDREDADTAAARKELRQTVLSDNGAATTTRSASAAASATEAERATPEADLDEERLKEQVSSPKKKRAHDEVELDEGDDPAVVGGGNADAKSDISTDSAKDRASRNEPEKKRPREGADGSSKEEESATSATSADDSAKPTTESKFEKSAFGRLGSSAVSGFGSLGASSSGNSVFGGPQTKSIFASATTVSPAPAPAPAPKLSFGLTGGPSPFGALGAKPAAATNGFGGGSSFGGLSFGAPSLGNPWASAGSTTGLKPLGGGLGSFGGGQKLTGGESKKTPKPFGAPDSEGEDDGEEEDGDEGSAEEGKEDEREEKKETQGDDKKPRLQRVVVNDGEAGEVTLLQVRAKMFFVERSEGGGDSRWVERGAGMLKINVPKMCVQFDHTGAPILGSYDASGLEDDDDESDDEEAQATPDEDEDETGTKPEKKAVSEESTPRKVPARLILRQDHTGRVLLNTAILPAMQFQEKASLKAVGVLFTAFEGDEAKPVSVQMRMSAASAKSFLGEVGLIQRELQSS